MAVDPMLGVATIVVLAIASMVRGTMKMSLNNKGVMIKFRRVAMVLLTKNTGQFLED